MQQLIQPLIQSFQIPVNTPPILPVSSFSHHGPDESTMRILILEENEHFINAYNQSQADDSDSDDAYDALLQISKTLPDAFLKLLLKHPASPLSPATKPTIFSKMPHSSKLLHEYTNQYNDRLSIQITDHLYYITFIESGQY